MGIKKLKKKLLKSVESIKSSAQDQMYYAKNILASVKSTAVLTLKLTSLAVFILLTSLATDKVHLKYIGSHVGNTVVYLRSPDGAKIQGSGTGFEIKAPSGKVYTLTNAHVCGLGKDNIIMVKDKLNSGRLLPKRIIEVYQENDLCLVEGLDNYPALSVASDIEIGEPAWAVGYPMGGGLDVSYGRVKEFDTVQVADDETPLEECNKPHQKVMSYNTFFGEIKLCVTQRAALQTSLQIYPGNSGSPLVNIYGNVIGVVFASQRETAWGSAVPLSYINDFLKGY